MRTPIALLANLLAAVVFLTVDHASAVAGTDEQIEDRAATVRTIEDYAASLEALNPAASRQPFYVSWGTCTGTG